GEDERKITLYRRIPRQGRKSHLAKTAPVELLKIEFSQKHVLPKFSLRRHTRIDLPELGYRRTIQENSRRASGMKIFGRLTVEAEICDSKCGQQTLHITLEAAECFSCDRVLALAYIEHGT